MPIVEVRELTKHCAKAGSPPERITAVDRVSFEIRTGEIFGLIGPNGAGKTTTLEMIEGLLDIDEGTVKVLGVSVADHPVRARALRLP